MSSCLFKTVSSRDLRRGNGIGCGLPPQLRVCIWFEESAPLGRLSLRITRCALLQDLRKWERIVIWR